MADPVNITLAGLTVGVPVLSAGQYLLSLLRNKVLDHIQQRLDRNELEPRLLELTAMLTTKLAPLLQRSQSACSSAAASLSELDVILQDKYQFVRDACFHNRWRRLWSTNEVLKELSKLHTDLYQACSLQMLLANLAATLDIDDATQTIAANVKDLQEQVRTLAANVGSRASPEGIAEALQLVARVQREAALDASGSGWGTDHLSKFLEEVQGALSPRPWQSPMPQQVSSLSGTMGRDTDQNEFRDPITLDIVVDPVIGSNGCTYDRLTAYQLMTHGSVMPGCGDPFKFGADNVYFRSRLRRAHPETEEAMWQQRRDCLQRAQTAFAAHEYGTARYWFQLVRTWSPDSAAAPLAECEAACAAPASTACVHASTKLPLAPLLPSAGFEQIAAAPVRSRVLDGGGEVEQGQTAPALVKRANEKIKSDEFKGAVSDLDAALVLEPHSESALKTRAKAKRMLGDHQGAVSDLDAALELAPGNAFALASRGADKRMLNDYKGAVSDLDAALELEPCSAFALKMRGDVKRLLDDYQGAVSDLDAAHVLEPHSAFTLERRGEAKRMLDDHEGAVSDLDAALMLEPHSEFALKTRGEAKRMLGDHQGAVSDLDAALELAPGNAFALASRGAAKRMLNDYKGAIADIEAALVLEPGNAFALHMRARANRHRRNQTLFSDIMC